MKRRRQRPKAKPTSHASLSRITINPKWRHRCSTKKLRYRDKREARWALHSMMVLREAGDRTRLETNYYKCQHCKGWHLTSKMTPEQIADLQSENAAKIHSIWRSSHPAA